MIQVTTNTQDSETSSLIAAIHLTELIDQGWERNQSVQRAENEGLNPSNWRWANIDFLRGLFAGIPVGQGSRIVNLHVTANANH